MSLSDWLVAGINLVLALAVTGAGVVLLRRAVAKSRGDGNWVGLAVGGALVALLGTIGVMIVILALAGIAT